MWSPTLKKMIALASVGREHAAAGTLLQMEMTVEAVGHTVAAKVAPLPFFNPPRKTGEKSRRNGGKLKEEKQGTVAPHLPQPNFWPALLDS
jgi:hypothetical protein